MTDTNILLSICIPTLNRAEYLDRTLFSITSQDTFINTNDIEIVISDNACEDNTEEIVKKYKNIHGDRIVYIKNQHRLSAMDNFYTVLSNAKGKFLKLHNDTIHINPDKLSLIVDNIKNNIEEKPILFFTVIDVKNNHICNNLNQFITEISFNNTWSGSFGIWKEDLSYLKYFKSKNWTQIAQTYILCKWFSDGKISYIIDAKDFFIIESPQNKGGYNIAEVFGKNYLNILKEFVQKGDISKDIYNKEKKKLLLKHINYYYFDLKNLFNFDKNGYFEYLFPYYKWNIYFYSNYVSIMFKSMFKTKNKKTC